MSDGAAAAADGAAVIAAQLADASSGGGGGGGGGESAGRAAADRWAVGDLLDCRDTVQKWMEGRVVSVDPKRGYHINYLGWSEKWNEWVPLNSSRLAPYRSYTTKSTAPHTNSGAFQLDGENLNKMRACAHKVTSVLAKAKIRADAKDPPMSPKQREQQAAEHAALVAVAVAQGQPPPPEPDSKSDFSATEWGFIHSELPQMVNNVLNAVIHDIGAVPDAARLLADFLTLCVQLLKTERDLRPALLECMVRALNVDPIMPGDKRFYTKYGIQIGPEAGDAFNKGKWAVRPKATGSGDSFKATSAYLIYNINLFGDSGGFDLIAKRIGAEGDSGPSFLSLGHFADLLCGLEQWFDAKMSKKFLPSLKWDIRTLLAKVAAATDEDLKLLSRDGLRQMVRHMCELVKLSTHKHAGQAATGPLQLAVILRLLQSDILEKRINALLDLHDMVRYLRLMGGAKPHPAGVAALTPKQAGELEALQRASLCWTTHKGFVEWVETARIVSLLLSAETHEELVKRAAPVLKYLASCNALPVDPLFSLFDSVLNTGGGVSKHESFVRIVFDLTSDLASELSDTALDQLVARLQSIPKSRYSDLYLRFLRSFALACSQSNPVRAQGFLRSLWDLCMAEQAEVSEELSQLALTLLSELLSLPHFEVQKIPYVEMCMKVWERATAPVPSLLRLLENMLRSFPERSDPSAWHRAQLIVALNATMKMFKVMFEQLEQYYALAAAAVTQARATLTDEERQRQIDRPTLDVRVGRFLHSEHVAARLHFLNYVLQQSPKLVLPVSCLDVLWRLLASESVLSSDRTNLLEWLMQLVEDGADVTSSGVRRRHYSCLTDDAMKHVFLKQLTTDDALQRLTPESWRCAEMYFCYVNFQQGCLAHPARRFLQVASLDNMLGLDAVWNAAMRPADKRVMAATRALVVALYTKLEQKLHRKRGDMYRLFLERCLEYVNMYRIALVAQQEPQRNLAVLLRLLDLLAAFVSACDKIQEGEAATLAAAAPPHSQPPPVDASFTLHCHLLSNHKPFFTLLFELLALGGEVASRVWALLQRLPTNDEMYNRIAALPDHAAATAAAVPPVPIDWAALLSAASTVKLLYALQLVQEHLHTSADDDHARAVDAWSQVFLTRGGFKFVYDLLLRQDVSVMVGEDPLSQQCLACMIQLLHTFMAFARGSQPALLTDAIIDYGRLIECLLAVVQRAVCEAAHVDKVLEPAPPPIADNTHSTPKFKGLLLYTFQLLAVSLSRLPASSPQLQLLTSFEPWDEILQRGLLEHPSGALRDQLCSGIELLCSDAFLLPAVAGAPPAASVPQTLTALLLPRLLALLPRIDTRSTTCESYFQATRSVLRSAHAHEVHVEYEALLQHLVSQVQQHPIVEARSTDEDRVLRGWLSLLADLLRDQPQLRESAAQLVDITFECLFKLPVTDNPPQQPQAGAVPSSPATGTLTLPHPKCKSPGTRYAAFTLLDALTNESPTHLLRLARLLLPLHLTTHSGGALPDEWEFESRADDKAECGYVGLKNLGATCYMNSTVQQFFMIPAFRQQLLAVEPPAEELRNPHLSVLCQLQTIMSFLQESEKQAFDPQGLCKSFVDFDGNQMNVGVQEDAASFVTRLVDKVMESSRGSPAGAALKAAIYGQTVDQFIGHPPKCNHYKERAEEFATVGLAVRNMKSVQDSLRAFVQGEEMVGSNAYKCSLCDAKVDTTKRTVFNALPPTLIFNLKRFEMDYNTMRTLKINDRIEFPMTLNMKPYTKEGIAEQERLSKAAAAEGAGGAQEPANLSPAPAKLDDDDYYEYELSGITVHTGSIDRGHYYSFIQEPPTLQQIKAGTQPRWIEFNDTTIRPFDPRSIEAECFGGTERIQQFSAAGRATEVVVEKQRNAYILFYTSKRRYRELQQQQLERAGADSPSSPAAATAAGPSPPLAKAPIPPRIFDSVWRSNLTYWRDRYMFDSMYAEWAWEVHHKAQEWIPRMAAQAKAQANQETAPQLALLEEAHTTVTQLATRFVLETLCRARHKQRLPEWSALLSTAYGYGTDACRWFLHALATDRPWNVDLLLACPIVEVRQALAELLCEIVRKMAPLEDAAMQKRALSPLDPDPVPQTAAPPVPPIYPPTSLPPSAPLPSDGTFVCAYADRLVSLLPVVPKWWRRFNQFWRVLLEFSRVSASATRYFLQRHNLLARICDLYLADASPLPDNYFRMPLTADKKRVVVGDTLVRPDMTAFLGLVARLACASEVQKSVQPPTAICQPLLPLSSEASVLLLSKPLLSRLVTDATSRKRGSYVSQTLAHLVWEDLELSKHVIGLIVTGMKSEQVDTLRPYFRVIGGVLSVGDSVQSARRDILLHSLLLCMEQHERYWSPLNFMIEHLIRLCKQQPPVAAWLAANSAKIDWMVQWLRAHPQPPRQGEHTLLHKPGRIDPITQLQTMDPHDYAAFAAPRCFPSLPHTSAQKIAVLERIRGSLAIDTRGGSDSDEELSERTFAPGDYVDVLDTANKWLVGRILSVSSDGRSVTVHYDNWHPKFDETLSADSLRITRFRRFSNGVIVEQSPAQPQPSPPLPPSSPAPIAAGDVSDLAARLASTSLQADASPTPTTGKR